MRKRSKNYNKPILLIASLLVVIIAAIYLLHRHNSPKISATPKPTISSLPHGTQPDNKGSVTKPSATNQGTATDTNGQTQPSTQSSQWLVSESGNITVKQPLSGSTISPGESLIGSATVSRIQYRLIDDTVGVISQGFLSVVNGDFSGSLSFTSKGSTGRLDVFSTDVNGKEINEVQIPVKY